MADIHLTCIGSGVFKATTPQDAELLKRFKLGDIAKGKFTKVRNPKFLAKFFAMLNVGFDAFEPVTEWKGHRVQKNYDRFREDVIITAGYFDIVPLLNGEFKAKAKSISFAGMEEPEFEKLYSEVANVLLEKVLTNYTRDDLDNVVNQILGFV